MIGLAVVAALIYMFLARSKRKAREEATGEAAQGWRNRTATDLDTAKLARDMLVQNREDPDQEPVIHNRVQEAATACDRAAASAVSDEQRAAATRVASGLRNLMFAQDAEQLLHKAAVPPSADQLASADAAWRARQSELEDALGALGEQVSVTDEAPPG